MEDDIAILIVDDVGTVRSFLNQTLVHLGIDDIDEAPNAAQCMAACAKKEYDIIFLDIELPDGDGKAMIADINAVSEKTNVVMVSAHSNIENVKEAIDNGAKGFVVKPFSPKKIAAILKKFYPKIEFA
ncbi:response regulator [Pseudoalteromonas sp. SSDWG2]|uniref:response regulator n=1 Tax=Pseudoalteromonas sp. SSDWG2 TaxID=3139391 RepID=UPI003BACACAD